MLPMATAKRSACNSRRRTRARPVTRRNLPLMARAEDDPITDQFKAIDLADGFHDQDVAALARLTAAGRAEQLRAREQLYRYIDAIWDHIKATHRGEDNLASDPAYSAVAGMRDLTGELHSNAVDAAHAAGDDD